MTWVWIVLAPILGGFVYGFERVIKARMQRRQGPPLLQPFYDMFKLMDKRSLIIHAAHALLAVLHFILLWVTIAAIFLGANLLYIIFLHLFALLVLVIAGYSVRSIYSHIGANRELLSILAYEPILILIAIGFYLLTGSFEISSITTQAPKLLEMPLLFIALLAIIPIKVKKSPFDVTEGHQEIVGGIEVEYSGLFFEFLYMAKFLEYIFIYSFVYLFAGSDIILGVTLLVLSFFIINLVDNATARVRTDSMLKIILGLILPLAIINLLWIVL
jgi:ech hydrogenase subunit B